MVSVLIRHTEGDYRLRVWLVESRKSDDDRDPDSLPLLSKRFTFVDSLLSSFSGVVCVFGAVCSANISSLSPPQSCLIANSNFSPHFPSSIAGNWSFFFNT